MKQAKFHTCKSIFIEFMLQNLKYPKTNPHESVTYKGSNRANAQYYEAICNSCYTVVITLAFFHIPWNHKQISYCSSMANIENGAQHTIILTLMKTEKRVSF